MRRGQDHEASGHDGGRWGISVSCLTTLPCGWGWRGCFLFSLKLEKIERQPHRPNLTRSQRWVGHHRVRKSLSFQCLAAVAGFGFDWLIHIPPPQWEGGCLSFIEEKVRRNPTKPTKGVLDGANADWQFPRSQQPYGSEEIVAIRR